MMKRRLMLLVLTLMLTLAVALLPAPVRAEWFTDLSVHVPSTMGPTLASMGIDHEALIAQMPKTCDVQIVDGMPQYPDHGYKYIALFRDTDLGSLSLVLADGVWCIPAGTLTQEDLAKGYEVSITYGDDSYRYRDGSLVTAGIDQNWLNYYVGDYFDTSMHIDDQWVTARYELDGSMREYIVQNSGLAVTYLPNNGLKRASLNISNTLYSWYPDGGWMVRDLATWTESACDAPEGYENYREITFRNACPPVLDLTPEPEWGVNYALSVQGPLRANFGDMGSGYYDLLQVPAKAGEGIVWQEGVFALEDRGYSSVSLSTYGDRYSLTKQGDYWYAPQDAVITQEILDNYHATAMNREGKYASEKIAYEQGDLISYVITALDGSMLAYKGNQYYTYGVVYVNDAGLPVEGRFSADGSIKDEYIIYDEGNTDIELHYYIWGELYYVNAEDAVASYVYNTEKGWRKYNEATYDYEPSGEPYGLEDYDAAKFLEVYPPEIVIPKPTPVPTATPKPTPTPKPTSSVDFRQYIDLRDGFYVNLEDQGIDMDAIWNEVPTEDLHFENGMPVLKDQMYGQVSVFVYSLGDYRDMECTDGEWRFPTGVVTSAELADGYILDVWFDGQQYFITEDGMADSVHINGDGYRVSISRDYEAELTLRGDLEIALHYDDLYRMTDYIVSDNDRELEFTYLPYGKLEQADFGNINGSAYRWWPLTGWSKYDAATGQYVSCDAPAGYKDATEESIMAMLPPMEVVGAEAPAPGKYPSARPKPELGTISKLYPTLDGYSFDARKLFSDLPNTCGLQMVNGLPVVPDNGYDKVEAGSYSNKVSMTLKDGLWQLPDGAADPSDFSYSCDVNITIGDWVYAFDHDELYSVTILNRLRHYLSTGEYQLDYHTGTAKVTGSYAASGSIRSYDVVLDILPEGFIQVKPNNQIEDLTCYGPAGIYVWTPGSGWTLSAWGADGPVACDAPAGYECVTEAWMAEHVKPQVVGGTTEPEVPTAPSSYVTVLPESLTVIEDEAFRGAALTDCCIPDSVLTIGTAAFKDCTALTFVRIPDSVTMIADDAFDGCDKLVIVCGENTVARTYADSHSITWITD